MDIREQIEALHALGTQKISLGFRHAARRKISFPGMGIVAKGVRLALNPGYLQIEDHKEKDGTGFWRVYAHPKGLMSSDHAFDNGDLAIDVCKETGQRHSVSDKVSGVWVVRRKPSQIKDNHRTDIGFDGLKALPAEVHATNHRFKIVCELIATAHAQHFPSSEPAVNTDAATEVSPSGIH